MYLSNFSGEFSVNGVIYYILYNEPQLDPLMTFFPFFLFGTVLGEMIFRLDQKKDSSDYKVKLKKNFIIPLILIGIILIIFGVIYNYPQFFTIRGSLAWNLYSLGIETILLMVFFSIEFLFKYKFKKSHRFLFYFSYYSFTVYLVHQLLYFLFLGQLDYITIWFSILITFILSGLILRTIYRHVGPYASIKALISKFSTYIAKRKYVE
jgi:membrane-bound acyltransferase YfiQ involved in biofilm formation